jgi:hypothetical protein
MTPSAVEKSPVVVLRWTTKAQQNAEVVDRVKTLLRDHNLVLFPSSGNHTTIMSASQKVLERQAHNDRLVKRRRVAGPIALETIMDFFMVEMRAEFYKVDSSNGKDTEGLFTVHEQRLLVLSILEDISVSDQKLLEMLSEDPKKRDSSTNLKYLLQSHGWVDTLTPLHVADKKTKILRDVWYPLNRMVPPVDDIEEYYGPEIAYCT